MNTIRFFRDSLTERYSHPLYRIPLDLHLGCPNRAPDGSGGCLFCAEGGSRAVYLQPAMSLEEQVRKGIEFNRKRYGAEGPWIAYFQAYTSTNAPAERLRTLFEEALALADFRMVIIGTRPDALPEETLAYLEELSHRYDLLVELGVQTSNDETLKRIRRGHTFAQTSEAVRALQKHGIPAAAHVILGLPGEGRNEYLATARELSALPFSGIKIHQLQILRNTGMEKLWRSGGVTALNEYDYARELAVFLRALPEKWVVMRLCADSPEEALLAPKWWMNKTAFTEMFLKFFASGQDSPEALTAVRTGDGSYTFYHPGYHQHFHSTAGAWTESLRKYLEPARLPELLAKGKHVRVLDVGFGMGCNAGAAVQASEAGNGHLELISLEKDPAALAAAGRLPEHPAQAFVRQILQDHAFHTEKTDARLIEGDARESVRTLPDHFFQAIFLDGFSPDTNPELWTFEFIAELRRVLAEDGILVSYSSAYPLRGALLGNGFLLYESAPFGRKRGGTAASLRPLTHLSTLPEKERRITLLSTAGTPYRDPALSGKREEILKRHAEEIASRRARGIPKWYRETLN